MTRMRTEGWLYAAIFLDLFGFGMLIADIQLRTARLVPNGWKVGITVGVVLASTFVVQTLVSPLWGALSDRIGRKPVLVICTLLSATAMLVYGLAGSVFVLMLSRILAGVSAANVAVAQALIADLFDEESRAVALGRIGAAVTAGLMVGPAVGGFVAKYASSMAVGLSAALLSATGALLLFLMIKEPERNSVKPDLGSKRRANWHLLIEIPELTRYALIAVVAWCSLATLEGTFLRLIHELFNYDQRHFGIIFGFESALGFLIQAVLLVQIRRRIKDPALLRIAYAMQGLGLALYPIAGGLHVSPMVVLLVASAVYAIGASVANPTINGICSKLCPPERQGELFGLLQGTRSIGFVIGPILGGAMFDKWAPMPYLFAGAVCVAAAALVPQGPLKTAVKPC